ncbi:MAG TPA: hypothetical protein VK157_03660 [Phycisphaerales bacterium]|nr:hypothetical protein [Phycisphaerales bacterium]
MHTLRHSFPLIALTAIAWASTAGAQPLDFVTIGAPGNRATNALETPSYPDTPRGSVGYEFRMMRTELTVAQHFEFAQAYLQFNPQAIHDPVFRGGLVRTADDQLVILPGTENTPSPTSWHMAARMCNWYHNGKVNEAWAFESGAYDTSTFVRLPDGSRLDQPTRSPGARFWIPSVDEWIKAAYYDPNRYGPGMEGYWQQPNGTNTTLISDYPQNGGQTNAGYGVDVFNQMAVGQYPGTQSPWALLDVSGGLSEWSEGYLGRTANSGQLVNSRTVVGSTQGTLSYLWVDPLEGFVRFEGGPETLSYGVRIAALVPAPGSVMALSSCVLALCRRRRVGDTAAR